MYWRQRIGGKGTVDEEVEDRARWNVYLREEEGCIIMRV